MSNPNNITAVDLTPGADRHEHDNIQAMLFYVRDNLPHDDRPYMVESESGFVCFVYKGQIYMTGQIFIN